jgi:hypothetical protein
MRRLLFRLPSFVHTAGAAIFRTGRTDARTQPKIRIEPSHGPSALASIPAPPPPAPDHTPSLLEYCRTDLAELARVALPLQEAQHVALYCCGCGRGKDVMGMYKGMTRPTKRLLGEDAALASRGEQHTMPPLSNASIHPFITASSKQASKPASKQQNHAHLADGALDVPPDGAAGVVQELHAHLLLFGKGRRKGRGRGRSQSLVSFVDWLLGLDWIGWQSG